MSNLEELSNCHKQLASLFIQFENDFKACQNAYQLISNQYFDEQKKNTIDLDDFWLHALLGARDRLSTYAVTKLDEGPLKVIVHQTN